MYQEERLQAILEYLKVNKRVSVEEICKLYGVSRDTARRDLVTLEKSKSIVRTHGGALLPTSNPDIKSYTERLNIDLDEKRAIGLKASSLIKDNDKIIMDTSTTVQACAEMLNAKNCTVVTNSINVADILASKNEINIHLLGGQLEHKSRFLYGPATIAMLSDYYADKVFIGAFGLNEKGLTIAHVEDAYVMRKMIEQAAQVIVLADYSKFGHKAFYKVTDLKNIDIIITDRLPDNKLLKVFADNKITIILSDS